MIAFILASHCAGASADFASSGPLSPLSIIHAAKDLIALARSNRSRITDFRLVSADSFTQALAFLSLAIALVSLMHFDFRQPRAASIGLIVYCCRNHLPFTLYCRAFLI
jgi:hypothetical protein